MISEIEILFLKITININKQNTKMQKQSEYKNLLKKLAEHYKATEDEWREMMNVLDRIFGQQEGYLIENFATPSKMFYDVEGVEEICEAGLDTAFYDLMEYTSDFEAFLEKTILAQMFTRMSPSELASFIRTQDYDVPHVIFGETIWMLTSTLGKHDFYVKPVGFKLYHDFRE